MTADQPCTRCGAAPDAPRHTWVEGDCILGHKQHTRATIGHVCTGCVDRHRDWLREVVELYGTLWQVLEPGSVPDDTAEHGKPRKQPASPAPIRLAAWAMLHDRDRLRSTGHYGTDLPDIPAVLTGWAQYVHDEHHWTTTAPDTVAGAAATLTAQAEFLARTPEIDTYDAELRWMRRHLRAAHGVTQPQPVGRCPSLDGHGTECRGPLWPDRYGRMAVKCGRCGREFGEAFLRHLGGMMTG